MDRCVAGKVDLEELADIERGQGNRVIFLLDGHKFEIYAPVSSKGDRGYRLVGTAHIFLDAVTITESNQPAGTCVRCTGKRD